jgi:hypothetical protein
VDASGKETRGAGTASAAIRASLEPSGEGTRVSIHTTMNVTGRPAQFGRGVIAEVGGKLVEKFAENLAQMISDGGVAPDGADASAEVAAAEAGTAEAGSVESAGDGSAVNGSAVATDAGPGPTESAAAAPAPVRTATVPPAGKDEDSINLIRLVGPAVLKRVLPVVVGIVALALVSRRWRHLRQRGEGSQEA